MKRARVVDDELRIASRRETGRWCAERRRSDVALNTEMRTLDIQRSQPW
jgi:hypothetical protein